MYYRQELDRIVFDSKFTPESRKEILASYEEWCTINTKLKRGDFKKLAERLRKNGGG